MRKFGILLSLAMISSAAFADSKICINEALEQTRAKITEHYQAQGMKGRLAWVKSVNLSGIISNGEAHQNAEYEKVYYTHYFIVGSLIINRDQFDNYAFYVRLNEQNCQVLKVALLRTGKSPFFVMNNTSTSTPDRSGLAVTTGTLKAIETPKDGSPQTGYTFAGQGEESVPALNEHTLRYYQDTVEKMVRVRD